MKSSGIMALASQILKETASMYQPDGLKNKGKAGKHRASGQGQASFTAPRRGKSYPNKGAKERARHKGKGPGREFLMWQKACQQRDAGLS